ncbi:MAG: uracil-DNA glycosylase [Oscillospiraceae bacterium]|nr:uracil-DNA glycosylase [Oscillospiraceae bacterium]
MDWEALKQACLQCDKCELAKTRQNVVFGVGPTDAEVLFVGEGPGGQEDLQGEPFVGPAGQFLDDMLSIIGLGRHNCYIGNIVKCRPPQNRDPLPTEQEACIGWLRMQTKLLQPKIIVCLGRIAAQKLISEDFKITKEHGVWFDKGGIRFMAMYHPSALLRDITKRPDTFRDLKKLREMLISITDDPQRYSV